jgi:hypothetical protein
MAVNNLHFGVVVGINRYPGISNLQHARAGAELFRDWLVDPNGGALPPGNVQLVAATAKDEVEFRTAELAHPERAEIDAAALLRPVAGRVAAGGRVRQLPEPDDEEGSG